jgi:hypothetical protein
MTMNPRPSHLLELADKDPALRAGLAEEVLALCATGFPTATPTCVWCSRICWPRWREGHALTQQHLVRILRLWRGVKSHTAE